MINGERRKAIISELALDIQRARQRCGLSMNGLAKMTGLSQSMVSRLEGGLGNPTLDSLLRIAEALRFDLGAVLTRATKRAGARGAQQ